LRAKQITSSDQTVLLAYILYNIVFAAFAYPLGRIADKIGMKRMLVIGLIFFVMVYAGLSQVHNTTMIIALLFLYGIYAAATDGVSKALVSNVVPKTQTASAIGFFTGWNSICTLIASSAAGWIWYEWSPQAMFLISAGGTLVAAVYLGLLRLRSQPYNSM
jgi:MFS family permease